MTTWKDGGNYGLLCREITDEAGTRAIAKVWTKQLSGRFRDTEPWPEGKRNFALILQAPQMLAALCSIRDQAECVLQPLIGPSVSRARWEAVRNRAVAAITATKGEGNDSIG